MDPMLNGLLTALHALGAVVWVGGMVFAHMALRPAAIETLEPPRRLALWNAVLPRFFAWVWVSMIALDVTGFVMIFESFGGFANVGPSVHAMAGLGLVMTALFVFLFFVPYRAFRAALAAGELERAAARQAVVRRIVVTNMVLGLVTVVIGSAGRFW